MKKLIGFIFCLLVTPLHADSSLNLAGGVANNINHGSASSLDNLSTWTQIYWFYQNTQKLNVLLSNKSLSGGRRRISFTGASGQEIQARVNRTSSSIYATNNASLSTGRWYYLAITFDSGASAGEVFNIYLAQQGGIPTELTYGTVTDGSGAVTNDSASNFVIGDDGTGNGSPDANLGVFWHYNRVLSATEIQDQMYDVRPKSGCVLYTHYGFNGTGTQPDWSGNANSGTISGTIVGSALGPPIFFPGGPQ